MKIENCNNKTIAVCIKGKKTKTILCLEMCRYMSLAPHLVLYPRPDLLF